ncbi:MAG: ABC transporter permease subunit, partial [Halobacteriovoraceae bacterium]|nr:ABC transporter permease subunit [Halobacteriovoraceae bacterium]
SIVLLLLSIYLFLAFIFPIGQLLIWSVAGEENFLSKDFWKHLLDTFSLAFFCGILVGGLALGGVFIDRFCGSSKDKFLSIFLKLGYAIPATIVALGVMTVFSIMEMNLFGNLAYLALLLGFLIRFYAVAFELQNGACSLIDKKFDWVSSSLGLTSLRTFCKVHLPLLRPAILSSMLICFLEASKEMPITLILRPYGVNTLSTKIYELTSEGEWERASTYAIVLLGLGVLSVLASEFYRNRKAL